MIFPGPFGNSSPPLHVDPDSPVEVSRVKDVGHRVPNATLGHRRAGENDTWKARPMEQTVLHLSTCMNRNMQIIFIRPN